MKKLSLFLIILLIIPISFSCNDLYYTVTSLEKNISGCYEFINFYITKDNCTLNCFSEFNNMKFLTENGVLRDYYFTDASAISNPFYAMIKTINCSPQIPSTFNIDFNGERNCSLSFSLEDEYQKLQSQNKTAAPVQEDTPLPSAGSNDIAPENQDTTLSQVPAQDNQRSNESLAPSDIIYNNQEVTQEFQKPQETGKKYTLPILTITAIMLVIGVATLLILKKPKRKIKIRRRRR